MNNLKNYWYIIAESKSLKAKEILSRQILDTKLVIWRDSQNNLYVNDDRCKHFDAPLSLGHVNDTGEIICHYHGQACKNSKYHIKESQGYIYICLGEPIKDIHFFPYYQHKSWYNLRLVNEFDSNIVNCIENFINVPHTAFVHRGIFRSPTGQKIKAHIQASKGNIIINYLQETNNLGLFSRFLNPIEQEIIHIDNFYPSNTTEVIYKFHKSWQYIITSQSIPISENKTIVYTDISYNFGILTHISLAIVYLLAEQVIKQDIKILNAQTANIEYWGEKSYSFERKLKDDLVYDIVFEIHDKLKQGQSLDKCQAIDIIQDLII